MITLAFNCGSSSLRCALVEIGDAAPFAETRLARARVERIGERASLELEVVGRDRERANVSAADHAEAVDLVLHGLGHKVQADGLAIGHRVVHGGARFVEPVLIGSEVLAAIGDLAHRVPLHNAAALAAIEATRTQLPDVPAVAVFDTAFHQRLDAAAAEYPLPLEIARPHGVRRIGFHGLAHRSMAESYARLRRTRAGATKIITLQLGNGASAAAVSEGRSTDVSMGFSPLEGLMMGTRSGDLDPAIVAHLAQRLDASAGDIVELLNTRAGLLGVSGRSADVRELLAAEAAGDARSALALEMFVLRIQKCVGAYLAALRGAEAIVFGGGIGEHSAEIRARVCRAFEWCGLALDADANAHASGAARISRDGATLEAWVVPVDEEILIARDTARCLRAQRTVGT
ncbi:MAG: acetate/propionate family kinase [Planctomycetota bacterium]